jgi:hypothetical protein
MFCKKCIKDFKNNDYCIVCVKENQNKYVHWVQCDRENCNKWVHASCDPYFKLKDHKEVV